MNMVFAEATTIDEFHLQLVINYPDGHKEQPVTVVKGEALRLVYFYNRLYICDTLKQWLDDRINVFDHVGAESKSKLARSLNELIDNFKKTSLNQVCTVIVQHSENLKYLAPSSKSRYYDRYNTDIIPILTFCHDMKGVQP